MSKLKNSSLFSHRNFIVLLISESSSFVPANVLEGPLVDEFKRYAQKVDLDVVHMEVENQGKTFGPVATLLRTIYAISKVDKPTLVDIPSSVMNDPSDDAKMLQCYIKMMVMASGGIIINSSPFIEVERIVEPGGVVPVINFNPIRNSWSDIEPKISSLIQELVKPANINFYNMVSALGNKARSDCGSLCLGDISRMWVAYPSSETTLSTIYNLSGELDSPITITEFADKIWCNVAVNGLDINRTLIVRSPSSVGRLTIGRLMAQPNNLDKNLKVINL